MTQEIPSHIQVIATQPYPQQRRSIQSFVKQRAEIPALVRCVGALRDPEPLLYTMRLLADLERLDDTGLKEVLGQVFLGLSDTSLHRLLQDVSKDPYPLSQQMVLVSYVEQAMLTFPLERIAALALFDRWLKNHAWECHQQLRKQAHQQVEEALHTSTFQELEDPIFFHLDGTTLASLCTVEAQRARLESFAQKVIYQLESAPKSISQANAEDILARRVYTDPGHFFVELLQNAEDAKATKWNIDIEAQEVLIWHDGIPFDTRDVVGVLSIGQTTKHKEQIGFFGVGFKSVYEVCERPQLYSGLFRFEIADVSVPRRLGQWPEGQEPEGSLLVLPLRDPEDPLRRPEKLYTYASEIPPETLLTLRHLSSFSMRHGAQRYAYQKEALDPSQIQLRDQVGSQHRTYWIEEEVVTFDTSLIGESSRTTKTPVMVAVALDQDMFPTQTDSSATIFSYLPTGEHSGLQCLLHAHFDVPVDRERLHYDSARNKWVLAHHGRLLCRALVRGMETCLEQGRDAVRWAIAYLEVMPLREDLRHPVYTSMFQAFCEATAEASILPAVNGEWLRPAQALYLDDDVLLPLLKEATFGPAKRRLLCPLPARTQTLIASLGVERCRPEDLRDYIKQQATHFETEGLCTEAFLQALPALFDRVGDAGVDLDVLHGCPVFPDEAGQLHKAADITYVPDSWEPLYEGVVPLLAKSLRTDVSDGQRRCFERLGLHCQSHEQLVEDLKKPLFVEAFTTTEKFPLLLEILSSLPWSWTQQVARLPLFPTLRGRAPLVADVLEEQAWLTPSHPMAQWFHDLLDQEQNETPILALISRDIQEEYSSLLTRMGGRTFSVEWAFEMFCQHHERWSDDVLFSFHEAWEHQQDELTTRLRRTLRATPLFFDQHGERRSLEGPERLYIPSDEDVKDCFPDAPWIALSLSSYGYIRALGGRAVGFSTVLSALLLEDEGTLFDPFDLEQLRGAYRYLSPRMGQISREQSTRLADAPIWLAKDDALYTLRKLRMLDAHTPEAWRKLYSLWNAHPLLDDEGTYSALSFAQQLPLTQVEWELTAARVLDDLQQELPPLEGDERATLVDAVEILRRRLSSSMAPQLLSLPLFLDEDGVAGPLVSWSTNAEEGIRRSTSSLHALFVWGGCRLLSEAEEVLWARLLDALDVRRPDIRDVLEMVTRSPERWQEEAAARMLRETLAANASQVALYFPPKGGEGAPALQALVCWPNEQGGLCSASTLLLEETPVLSHSSAESLAWKEILPATARLHPDALEQADALRGLVFFADPVSMVLQRLQEEARPNAPLDEQPSWFRELASLVSFVKLAWERYQDVEKVLSFPLVLDAEGLLTTGLHVDVDAFERLWLGAFVRPVKVVEQAWSEHVQAICPELVGSLKPEALLRVIAASCKTLEGSFDGHEVLHEPTHRAQMYDWLYEHRAHWEASQELIGLLGHANLFPNRLGIPSSARVLLLNAEIPDVQIGWEPHDELPSSLLSWLRQTYPFDEDQRKRLADALVAELRLCAGDEDIERSRDLLLYLAYSQQEQFSATGGEHVLVGEEGWSDAAREAWKERIARLRLHRQLKVANQDGTFQRLKELWCPQEAHLDFLERCMDSIPDFISLVYRHPAIDALFDAAGIHMYLTLEQLEPLFTRWEGEDAPQDIEGRVAFATYLAMCVEDNHALVHALKLRDRAWIPNGEGTQCRPSALYWPNPIVKMVLGEQPALFPDPTLSYTVLTQLQESLSFRQSDEVTLEDVLKQIPSGEPAPRDLLEWLEKSLLQKQLTPQEVREHLLTFPCFLDEDGLLRPARELLRGEAYMLFGRWRGVWPLAAEYPKLAASLKLPTTPKAHDIQTYLHDVAHYIEETDAAALLREEPELFEQLIRCLEALVELDAPPLRGAFPLPCVSQEGARVLVVFPAEGVAIVPPEHDDIDTSDVAYWVSVEGELRASLTAYLERCGVDVLQQEAPVEDLVPEMPDVQKLPEKVESSDRGERRRAKRAADKLDTPAPLQHKKAKEKRKRPRPAAQIKPLTKGKESPNSPRKTPKKLDRLPQKPKKTSLPSTEKAQKGQHTQKQQETSEGSWWDRLWDRFRGEDGGSESTSPQNNKADAQSKRKKDDSRPIHAPRREMPSWSSSSSGRRDTSDYTPQRHDSWFRHQSAIQPQLEGARSWIMDHQRTPEFGFAFAPSSLPTPWMYASMMIGDSFERRSQKWRSALSKAEWATSEREEGRHSVLMRGRIPKGENLLPMPLFGRLLEVEAPEHVRLVEGRHMLPVLIAREDADVRYKVALGQTPVFDPQPITDSFPKGLLLSTVPDRELPLEVHLFLDELVSREQSPVENAYAVRAFIKEHYRYDPSYLEDPEVAQWLRKVTRGQANMHVAALHAGRDAQALGRGVCYELNALACELLRRVGVPAAVSSGWTMDRGQLAQPDHMWAMALLPSDMGLRWLPIDASTTRQGRPLHAARRADGPWRIPPSEAPHSTPAPPAMPSTPASTVSIDRTKAHILGELLNATEHLAAMTRTPKEEDVWRQRWQEILAEPALAEALLQWLLEGRSE